jgi:Uma2 family endonuclease
MVASKESLYTLSEFQEFVSLPENADRLFELINGEIIEVSPGRTRNSELPLVLASVVRPFCQKNSLPCHTSGADGAYNINGQVIAPDFAYKPTPMSDEYPDAEPPLWAVEIISPTDKAADIRAKRQIYIDAGILLWEMYPQLKRIDVYQPDRSMKSVGIEDMLDGSSVLPNFTIAVKDIFNNT